MILAALRFAAGLAEMVRPAPAPVLPCACGAMPATDVAEAPVCLLGCGDYRPVRCAPTSRPSS